MAAVERLKRRPDFLKVASGRRKWVAPGLILQALPRTETASERDKERQPDGEAVRVGFTASRKVGNAVARNRARRRLRAVAAQVMPQQAQPGHDYVLIARSATLTRTYRDLIEDLVLALRRVEAPRPSRTGGPR